MDNLLGSIKDIAVIKKCLAAINQTTDDFLFAFDIPGEQVEFFGPINEFFELGDTEKNKGSFEDFLKKCENLLDNTKWINEVIQLASSPISGGNKANPQ